MISVKYGVVIVAAFVAGSFFAPPVQQAIAAVIATDVQCTGCVGANDIASSAVTTTKLASNSVNGGKISDGTISAADLGPDSVGASELKGVSKLIFAECTLTSTTGIGPGASTVARCSVPGTDSDDRAIATLDGDISCFSIGQVKSLTDVVDIYARNDCSVTVYVGTLAFGIIVFDK